MDRVDVVEAERLVAEARAAASTDAARAADLLGEALVDGLARVLVDDPRFAGVRVRVMAVLAGSTSIAGGPVAALAARSSTV